MQFRITTFALALLVLLLLSSQSGYGQSQKASPSGRAASGDSLNRSILPIPDPPFEGKIGRTFEDSVASFIEPVRAPDGAPNVLVIMIDDLGFGQTSTFGGPVPTPNLDKLAAKGLKYTRFHVTALCSPTRAAIPEERITKWDWVSLESLLRGSLATTAEFRRAPRC